MRLTTRPDKLLIQFEGFERLWALRNALTIPKPNISDVLWLKRYEHSTRLIRIGGTAIPARLSAGAFYGSGERVFLYLRGARGLKRRTSDVLVIRVRDFGFNEVALSLDKETASDVINWWRSTSRPK